ncbi:shikimate kinase [Oribacterium sp. oral taxon 102]|uniref:shikimate kinase n=1 Tax=Oribacterium sp. oral taxon 102 TaxID=671214 RepID=UPI0015B9A25D|nr:shikimate kinase [Oribacterium sp. oral taxon 102]NWO21869.1 shikimate kinase [Oribacterium sp. oral taxon 102]
MDRQHLFLIGFMGVGKSTVARVLCERLGLPLIETDARIEAAQGMTITELFRRSGEACFRDLETALLQDLSREAPAVVSCGGGIVLRPGNVRRMKESGSILLLTASPEHILRRVSGNTTRPILNGNMNLDHIRALMERRMPAYLAAADLRISTDGKPVAEIVSEILSALSPL